MNHDLLTAIWNRAASDSRGMQARGDRALSALLHAHGLVMNGGVLNAVEMLSDQQFDAAVAGYRFFGIEGVGDLLTHAKADLQSADDVGSKEQSFAVEYSRYVPSDSFLFAAFERRVLAQPTDFAPA